MTDAEVTPAGLACSAALPFQSQKGGAPRRGQWGARAPGLKPRHHRQPLPLRAHSLLPPDALSGRQNWMRRSRPQALACIAAPPIERAGAEAWSTGRSAPGLIPHPNHTTVSAGHLVWVSRWRAPPALLDASSAPPSGAVVCCCLLAGGPPCLHHFQSLAPLCSPLTHCIASPACLPPPAIAAPPFSNSSLNSTSALWLH